MAYLCSMLQLLKTCVKNFDFKKLYVRTSIIIILFPVTTALPVVETITIAVSVSNKTIRLPESSSSLTAFTVPAPTKDNPFSYEWKAQESNLQGAGLPTKDETVKTT